MSFAALSARGSLLINDGYRTKASELGTPGYPVLRVAEIADGSIQPSFGDHVRSEFRDKIGFKLSRAGDVLLTTKGTIGRRAVVPSLGVEFAYSPQVCFFRVLDETIDNRWLYYWLGGTQFWSQATGVSQQTDMAPYISLRDLRSIEIDIPPIEKQRGIAATLGALDDKIESNRKAIETVQQLLLAEFQRVVREGSIEMVPLGELSTVTKGISYRSADLQPSRTSLVTLKSFDRSGGYKREGLKPYVGPFKASQVIAPGELAVAQTDLTQGAEVVGRAIRVPADVSADVLVASLDLALVRPSSNITNEYLWGVLTDSQFREHCRARTSGTTVLHLAGDAIAKYLAPLAAETERTRYSYVASSLAGRADCLVRESVTLAALRDALLPELLSGRIRVPEAREALEDAF